MGVEDDANRLTEGFRDRERSAGGRRPGPCRCRPLSHRIRRASGGRGRGSARPEIHCESPGAVEVRPSSDIAIFRVTSGSPVRACLRNGWLSRWAAAACAPAAKSTFDPAVAEDSRTATRSLLARILGGDHDPPDLRLQDRLGARWLPSLVRTRLERHVHRRPGRILPPPPAVLQRHPLRVEIPQLGVKTLADDLPILDDHSPDQRVRTHTPTPPLGQFQRPLEVRSIRDCELRVHATD